MLVSPTAGSLEQPQPERHVPFSVYALLSALHMAFLSSVPDELVHGFVAVGCGVFVIALFVGRTLGLPYLPVAIGAVCGSVNFFYTALLLVAVGNGVFADNITLETIYYFALQTGFICTLYGGLVAAAVLKRIRLTRFLIIAVFGIVACIVIGSLILTTQPERGVQDAQVLAAQFPIFGLFLVLIQIALVRPDSLLSLRLFLGCLLFAVVVTAADSFAAAIAIPMPIIRWSGSLVTRPEIVVANADVGSAVQFLFVPGSVAAILSYLAKPDAEKGEGWRTALSPLLCMARAYRPPNWMVTVPLFLVSSIKFPAFGESSLAVPLLFIPLAAALAATYGAASLPVLFFGGLPLLVQMPLGPLQTIGNPAILLAAVLVHHLVADPQFRTRCLFATSIGTVQLIALTVLLASTYQLSFDFRGGTPIVVGGTLQLALDYLMFAIGASQITIRPVLYTVAGAGVVGIVLSAPFISPAFSLQFGPAAVQQVTTAIGFLLLGRFFFHRQLPSLLRSPVVLVRFDPSQEIMYLIGGIALLSLVSHLEIRYGLPGGRMATDGLISPAVLQPMIFMLGLSLGPRRALIYAAVGIILGELLPSLISPVLGLQPVSLLSGKLRLGMSFGDPLTLAVSHLGDLAFGIFGWRVLAAFRPNMLALQATAASQSKTPAPMAA